MPALPLQTIMAMFITLGTAMGACAGLTAFGVYRCAAGAARPLPCGSAPASRQAPAAPALLPMCSTLNASPACCLCLSFPPAAP